MMGFDYMSLQDLADVSVLFDDKYYTERYGIDPNGEMDPPALFAHWKNVGRFQGMDPHPLFPVEYYAAGQDASELEKVDHITHFLTRRRSENASPHAAFDSKWYLSAYSDVRSAGVNPLIHYLQHGHKEGRRPSPTFDGTWYLRKYGDVRESGMNPLVHFVMFGRDENRFQSESDFETVASSKRDGTQPRTPADGYRLQGVGSRVFEPVVSVEPGPSLRFLSTRLASAKLLSLDIWDTLLYRRCHPDEIKLASARLLFVDYRLRLRGAYRDVTSLYKARRVAEDASSLTNDFEYRFEDAALRWVEMVFEAGTPKATLESVVQQLAQYELSIEARGTYVNTAVTDLLDHEKHPPVVFVSDFYMSGKFMLALLQAKRVEHNFLRLYCSSDYVENKRSGALFQRVATDFGLAPAEIWHIGDNKNADFESAQAQGLLAYHYRSARHEAERSRANQMMSARLAADFAPLNYALVEQLIAGSRAKIGEGAFGPLGRLGYVCAPLAIGFILHVIERARLYGVKKVFFFTREGIFLKKLYDAVVAQDPYGCGYPEAVLLEVSRIATFAPSIQSWDEPELMRLWSLYSTQSPAAFTKSLNISEVDSKRLFGEAGIKFDVPIEYPWLNADFMSIIKGAAFTRLAQEAISAQRVLLQTYLAQRGFEVSGKINLIVDIGWRGSIQDNLSRLCNGHVHGCYLGLFGFLNPQPLNGSKSAWLFDFNVAKPQFGDIEVAPIEMLFNSLGGSVSGYVRNPDDSVSSVKKSNAAEEGVFLSATRLIQDGIMDAVPDCVDFVSIRGLTSGDILHAGWNAFEGLLRTPTPEFAAAFFSLSHNEVFGTGEYYGNDAIAAIRGAIATCQGPLLHSTVSAYLDKLRWTPGLAALPDISSAIATIGDEARNLPSSLITRSTVGKRTIAGQARIGFIIPAPIVGSGGHRTIFKIARQFALRGCEVYCYLESEGDGIHVAKEMIGDVDAYIFIGWDKAANLDVAFATIAHSATFVAEMPNVELKCYLVQDYEAFFNPIGDYYTIAENSYMFGLQHFTIGKWLTHVLEQQHDALAIPSGMGIDLKTYSIQPKVRREFAICYLYQPEKPRRNGLLGIEAMRLVKEKLPNVKIYVYGSNSALELGFETEQLGLIRDLSELNALYNRCAVGLCMSMSNPSRIPFEMMACGTVPVDVYRYNNLFDYMPGTAVLAYQSANSVAHAIIQLLGNKTLLAQHRRRCVEFTAGRSAQWEADVVVNSVFQALSGQIPQRIHVDASYVDEPVIAPSERTPSVTAFCAWQRRLAMSIREKG
jgi:O-antigen biosynthesis protein